MQNNIHRNIERAAVVYQPYVNRALVLLVIMLTLSVFLYSAFLLEAVANAAAKTTAERNTADLSDQLATLESNYLALTESLTPEKVTALGFVTPVALSSVYAHGESGSLSFQSK